MSAISSSLTSRLHSPKQDRFCEVVDRFPSLVRTGMHCNLAMPPYATLMHELLHVIHVCDLSNIDRVAVHLGMHLCGKIRRESVWIDGAYWSTTGAKALGRSQSFVIRDEMHLKRRRPNLHADPGSKASRTRLLQVRESHALKPLLGRQQVWGFA